MSSKGSSAKEACSGYTKEELVKRAVSKLDMVPTAARKLNKEELCKQLKIGAKALPKLTPSRTSKTKATLRLSSGGKVSVKTIKVKTFSPKPEKTKQRKGALPCLSGNMTIRAHQEAVAKHMIENDNLIVTHGVGSGKTLAAVAASQCVLDAHPQMKVLVVTPVSLQENFKKEMRQYGARFPSRYSFETLTGLYYGLKSGRTKIDKNTFVIVDEAHNLRSENSARYKVISKALYHAGKILLLTATPVVNNYDDLESLIKLARRDNNPFNGATIDDVLKNPTLRNKYLSCLFSFFYPPRDENYPKLNINYVNMEMSKDYYDLYKKVEKSKEIEFGDAVFNNPKLFYNGLRQATNGLPNNPKVDWAVNAIREGKKTVVYSSFKTNGINRIIAFLDKLKIQHVSVTGDMSMKKRAEAVDKFNKSKNMVLFITKAGGEGLDLKGVRKIIILESVWNPSAEEQIFGRAARYKSHAHLPAKERVVDAYYLVLEKPKKTKDKLPSADVILFETSKAKNKLVIDAMKELEGVAIENTPCKKGGVGTKVREFFLSSPPKPKKANAPRGIALSKKKNRVARSPEKSWRPNVGKKVGVNALKKKAFLEKMEKVLGEYATTLNLKNIKVSMKAYENSEITKEMLMSIAKKNIAKELRKVFEKHVS